MGMVGREGEGDGEGKGMRVCWGLGDGMGRE